MAIIYPILGRMKGSLGNVTTRKHYASAAKVIASQKANIVKNPKTLAQAQQRLKISPLVKVYSHLRQIICHSFQGITYGMSNYAAYLKANMNGFAGPYTIKGTKIAVPGAFVISRGSLPSVNCSVSGANPLLFSTDIKCGSLAIGQSTTVADIANAIIAANSDIENKDQLTFIGCIHNNGSYDWNYERLVLDTSDTTLLSEKDITGLLSVVSEKLAFTPYIGLTADTPVICGGVIVSRYSSSSKTWQRSNCTLNMFELSDTYFGALALEKAVESYQGVQMDLPTSSNWYLNGGNEDNTFGFYAITKLNKSVTLGGGTNSNVAVGLSASGKNKMLYTKADNADTFYLAYINDSKQKIDTGDLYTSALSDITKIADDNNCVAIQVTNENLFDFWQYVK